MGKLFTFVFVLLFCKTGNAASGSHSLLAFATYIIGETPFPEFTVVLLLDDVQLVYYDSNDKQIVYRGRNDTFETQDYIGKEGLDVCEEMYEDMKMKSSHLKQHFNLTEGVQLQQRITGCEMHHGEPTLIMGRDTFNADQLSYQDFVLYSNLTHFTYNGGKLQTGYYDQYILRRLYENDYLPMCMTTLKSLLMREMNIVMRKVPPRLRLIKKEVSGGLQVTCLAFGFYPRHINLTLLKDSQPVPEQELTGGELLPSGDGTYQMRKSLEVSREELKQRHNYSCTAFHLGLDNKLVVTSESGAKIISNRSYTLSLLLFMFVIIVIIVMCLCYKLRSPLMQNCQRKLACL